MSLKLALRLKLIGDVVRRDDAVGLIVRLPSNVFFRLTTLTKTTVALTLIKRRKPRMNDNDRDVRTNIPSQK